MLHKKSAAPFNLYAAVFSLALIRVALIALLLLFLVPIDESKKFEDEDSNRGNMRIEITWEDFKDVDVDLWVKAPGEPAVGWSAKNGKTFNLVRDDLGNINNPTGKHYEVTYGRGLPPGEYIVNLHLYANREQNYPIVPVTVAVVVIKEDNGKSPKEKIFTKTVNLLRTGDEVTVIRFKILPSKDVDASSLNDVDYPLYKAQTSNRPDIGDD